MRFSAQLFSRVFGPAAVIALTACNGAPPPRFGPSAAPGMRGFSLQLIRVSIKNVCDFPLARRGVAIPAIVDSFDSSGSVVVSAIAPVGIASIPGRFQFQMEPCLPIENHDGRRETTLALTPGRWIVLWVSNLMIPTQPVKVTPTGIEVFNSYASRR